MANFPLLRSAFGLGQSTSNEPAGSGPLALATAELIADYTGPVVIFDGAGVVQSANGLAKPILEALDGAAGLNLRQMLEDVLTGGGVASKRFQIPIATGEGVFDITLLPEGGSGNNNGNANGDANGDAPPARVLLLARDSTFDVNFGRALVASRQLFKDLVSCSADFVWETDAEGCFTFVSGRGLLGYSPDELDGRAARELLADTGDNESGDEAPLNPFESLSHLDEVECWLLDRDNERTCVRASCLPVFDDNGSLQGVRGVCRDITKDKQRQAELARAQDREQLSRSIVDSIRDAVTPEEMFTAAAAATHSAMGASHIWILRENKDDSGNGGQDGGLHQAAGHIDDAAPALDIMAEARETFSGDPERVHHTVMDGHQILLVPCHFRYQPKGVLGVALRDADALEEAVTTLLDIAAQLGIDMDYFKSVNDTHGHQVGDAALVAVAKILSGSGHGRQGDITGRLGGDEFAIWLEETELEGGRHKAAELLADAKSLQKYSGDADHPLGLSVGIAVADPEFDNDLDCLMARADAALYEAKRGGRGRAVVAERPIDNEDGSEGSAEC